MIPALQDRGDCGQVFDAFALRDDQAGGARAVEPEAPDGEAGGDGLTGDLFAPGMGEVARAVGWFAEVG